MNRIQRKRLATAIVVVLTGLAMAVIGPIVVMGIFATSLDLNVASAEEIGRTTAAIDRAGLVALALQLSGFAIALIAGVYALVLLLGGFIGPRESNLQVPR